MASTALKYPHSSLWPTKVQYLWLLRTEASYKGLLFNSEEIDMHPESFNCDEAYDRYEGDFTPEQWLDVSSCTKQETSSSMPTERETDDARITDSTEREALLKTYAWLYLEGITKNIEKKLLEVGATKSQNRCSEDAVLHDLGTLWASTVAKAPKEDKPQACIGIFSDIPQEETSIEYINIAFDTTLAKFKTQAANPGVVRYLIKKHHPELAETLFLDDIIVYHHPYPTAIDDSDPSFPAQIYPITRDYEATDNGWYAHVIPLEKATMVNQHRDWRPINTEADWQSLLRLIRKGSARSVFMRHKSVEDRINFVKRHREREELEIAKTGGFYTNVFLSRHMETLSPTDKFEVPAHPDQNISGEEWLSRVVDQQRRDGKVFEDEVEFFAQL